MFLLEICFCSQFPKDLRKRILILLHQLVSYHLILKHFSPPPPPQYKPPVHKPTQDPLQVIFNQNFTIIMILTIVYQSFLYYGQG